MSGKHSRAEGQSNLFKGNCRLIGVNRDRHIRIDSKIHASYMVVNPEQDIVRKTKRKKSKYK